MKEKKKIIISGGGICGLTTAIALQNLGFEIEVYEAAPEFKAIGAGLVLSANALKALKAIGIVEGIVNTGNSISSFFIKSENGEILSKGASENVIISDDNIVSTITIHRAELQQILLSKLNESVRLFTNKKVINTKNLDGKIIVKFEDGKTAIGDYLLACDGLHSNIRKQFVPYSKVRYAGYTCWRGVLEHNLTDFDTKIATETWGRNGRFGLVPLSENRIYWFACINSKKEKNEFYEQYRIEQLEACFKDFHFPIPKILNLTAQKNIHWDDISDLKPLKQFAFGNVLLMGDAGHATTPNMGQGACQAIEDAVVLRNLILNHTSLKAAFIAFNEERLPRTTQIVNSSWMFGKLAQIPNGLGIKIRNFMIKNMPASITKKQISFLYNIEFE